MEVILKKKKIDLGTYGYKLTKTQVNALRIKEPVTINIEDLYLEENLIFFSMDYGYCLVRNKSPRLLNNEEVWLIECFLENTNKRYDIYISNKQFKELISCNVATQNDNGKNKGYVVPIFKAILA